MNLYRVNPSSPFLEILANFILDNFVTKDSINNLKVILPNGIACLNLQDILVKKQTLAILPKIIPLANIMAEGKEIFKIPSANLEVISCLQEKIILTEIIQNYSKLKFSTQQALQFCPIIAELFYVLACYHLSIDDVNISEQKNLSSHWDSIYEFLQYTYHTWNKKLISLRKQDRVKWQMTMLESEITRLKHSDCSLIVAGIVGSDLILWNFLKDIASLPRGFIVLPPIDNIPDLLFSVQGIAEEDCLYNFKKLLGFLGSNLSDCQLLGADPLHNTILNKLIIKSDNQVFHEQNVPPPTNIKYIELEDIFEEAEQISWLCGQYTNKKIAIIVDNPLTKSFYCNFLTKYSLEFQDLLGNNLSQTLTSSLIVTITQILCNNFDLQKLFYLLKNPLINSRSVQKLELLIKGKNRFILSTQQLLTLIESSNDKELIEWGKKLMKLLYQYTDNNFIKILESSIKIAEKLYPDIWYETDALELANFLSELLKNDCNLILENKKSFPELLKTLMTGYKYFTANTRPPNIIIGKTEDLVLLKFDLIILADSNHGIGVSYSSLNKWINEKTLQELQITATKTKTSTYHYFFYLLLHNTEVIITRAKRQNGKSGILPSNLLLKLEFLLGNQFIKQASIISNNNVNPVRPDNIQPTNRQDYIHSPIFPDILSATNIEMLIRNPYSFYAKTILKLRPREITGRDPKISEFGIFIHKILEQYSTNYAQATSDPLQSILDTSYDVIQHTNLPLHTKKIWQTKFIPIAKSFIEFDEERRKHFQYIYPECRGEITLTIAGKDLRIMAVADRIEINDQQQAVIIDYKTGTLPNKQDVELGLSPQLIIEALILVAGGFGIQVENIQQIMYVKFSSSPPYIQTVEIDLSKEKLNKHQQGMLRLLEHYITNKNFTYEIDLLTYNDYQHLARTISSIKTA